MKKKLLALVCALALTVSLVGCVFSTPDTVGKIGDFEVTSGLYLLAQYDAYQQAAQLAGSEQDASKVKSFLKATITTNADTGETAVVSDYVAQKTLETLQTLAAVDARFTELGGELTEEQKSAADSYAQQLMDNYGDTYTANGIGLETLKLFQQLQYKHTLLLDLVYGKNGETPVEDGELTEHLDSTMYEIGYARFRELRGIGGKMPALIRYGIDKPNVPLVPCGRHKSVVIIAAAAGFIDTHQICTVVVLVGGGHIHDAAQDLLAESHRGGADSENALAGLKVGDGLQACLVSVAEIMADRAVKVDIHKTRQRVGTACVDDFLALLGRRAKHDTAVTDDEVFFHKAAAVAVHFCIFDDLLKQRLRNFTCKASRKTN